MNPNNNGQEQAPVVPAAQPVSTPPAQAVPAPQAPVSTPPVTPAPAAPVTPPATPAAPEAPAQGAESAAPVAPAPQPPEQPRESAQVRRAREAREKADGLNRLANRLDPVAPPAAPQPPVAPQAPAAPAVPSYPVQPQSTPIDYIDENGDIDTGKLNAYNAAEATRIARQVIADDRAAQQAVANQQALIKQVQDYATTVESDATYLSSSIDELNPTSDNYSPTLDDYIERKYKQATTDSQGNIIRTDISLREFAIQQVEFARAMGTAAAASQPNLVAGQATDTAVVPGPSAPAAPKIEDLPVKERIAARRAKLGYATNPTPPTK